MRKRPWLRRSATASFYWEANPGGPSATLIAVAATYLEPENYDMESLRRLAKRPGDREMSVLKEELREAIRDAGRLPGDELLRHVEYDDGSDEAFPRRLWLDLYGDERSPQPGSRTEGAQPSPVRVGRAPSVKLFLPSEGRRQVASVGWPGS